jgi:D-alanyl-D-alanine carboxypeptidase/D-alanyl-D-alanine-endopeptidase (penicillin-binding protein 4)
MCSAAIAAPRDAAAMKTALKRAMARHPVDGATIGVAVQRLSDGRLIFTRNANTQLEIASNAKLFTTAAALWKLGPDYKFRTSIIANGVMVGDMLQGDLVIVGGGDPCISGRFHKGDKLYVPHKIVEGVWQFGIRKITGDLVMDDRFFDRALRPPGWARADWLWWYGAPVSALSYNDNCVYITVTGAKKSGQAPTVRISPSINYARMLNRAVTSSGRSAGGLAFSKNGAGAIVITGRIRTGRARGDNITVENPPMYLAAAIRTELTRAGITVKGKSRVVHRGERALAGARTVYVWKTPLINAVNVANTNSQNFFAEQILKTMGAAQDGQGATSNGLAVVMRHVESIGISRNNVSLADGSGLSAGNRATPRAIVKLLHSMYGGKHRRSFFNSLATNGGSQGTMKRRMTHKSIRGRIHAKTGTIKSRGISALSGYAKGLDGEVYAFAVIVNGFKRDLAWQAKVLENSICGAVIGVSEEVLKSKPKKKKATSAKRSSK